ncbi:transmembrane channel-like protein [Mytilus trossulus]|uniref:transmembrane channel-like protein n=1 Tax=Mytilus trossulus TaxID=6551 RepID=UPI0030063036
MTQTTIPTTTMTITTAKTMSITTTLPTTVPTTITTTTVPSTTITETTKITEIAISTSTDGSVTTNPKNKPDDTDNDDTTVLGVGASVGGLVIIIVVIAVIYIYRRNHSKSASKPASKEGLAVNNDNDDYGLRENVLYIPADSTPLQTNDNWQNTHRISVDIDGNYSTVDLDEIPSVEESTGDYSSIELKKRTPSKSNLNRSKNDKPIIASKPKQNVTIKDDVYSVPDKKRVKHVAAPGENGCEYAVVSKPNKSNVDKSKDQASTSNVYAVVAKTKRLSNEKGTNQKRDSLTSENDKETDRSSKS